jgi:hypothetical protein
MVEQQPSKLMTRVRFPSPAPIFLMIEEQRLRGQESTATATNADCLVGPSAAKIEASSDRPAIIRK